MASDSIKQRLSNLTPAQRDLLAKKMIQKKETLPSNVLILKEGDPEKRKPIFCLHPPLGVTGYYLNIANYLTEDQPVYGIQCPALNGGREAHNDMREMAVDYFNQIKAVQPDPPYQLLGHSSGAFIAYEISQLVENQEDMPFLFCVDQHAPVGDQEIVAAAYSGDDLEYSVQTMFLTCWFVSMAHNCELTFTDTELAACETREQRYELVAGFFKHAGFLPHSADSATVTKVLHMIANHFSADSKYIEKHNTALPPEKYDGKLILFRSTEKTVWVGLGVETEADISTASGWDGFCNHGVEVVGIPGSDHINIFLEPAVKTLAQELEKYLYKVS